MLTLRPYMGYHSPQLFCTQGLSVGNIPYSFCFLMLTFEWNSSSFINFSLAGMLYWPIYIHSRALDHICHCLLNWDCLQFLWINILKNNSSFWWGNNLCSESGMCDVSFGTIWPFSCSCTLVRSLSISFGLLLTVSDSLGLVSVRVLRLWPHKEQWEGCNELIAHLTEQKREWERDW